MKITTRVTSASVEGDSLVVRLEEVDADGWRPMQSATLRVDLTFKSQRAYRVGRVVEIVLVPK